MLTPRFPIDARVLTPAGFGVVVSQKGEIRGDGDFRWIWWRYEIALRDANALVLMPQAAIEPDPRPVWINGAAQRERLQRRIQKAKRARRQERRQQQRRAAA